MGNAHTWEAAVLRFQGLRQHRAPRTVLREMQLLEFLRPHLAGLPVEMIRRGKIEEIRAAGYARQWKPRTVNYALGVVRAVLRACAEWEWLTHAPAVRPERMPRGRCRWLRKDEARALLGHCRGNLRAMMVVALATGLRQGTLCALEWRWVDWEARVLHVPGAAMKARLPLTVPLNGEALAALASRLGQHPRWVWSYRGERVAEPSRTDFARALRAAGITDFTWHDLRHTWASWHVQGGTPLAELQRLGGWETLEMVMRYAHLEAPRHDRAQSVQMGLRDGAGLAA